jgi:hypothetical protein
MVRARHEQSQAAPHPPADAPLRALRVPFTLAVIALLMMALAGPRWWDRAFWLDECLTLLVASDPSLDHGLASLAGGVDTNPPVTHLLLNIVGSAFGHTPLVYRATMTGCFLLAGWCLLAVVARRSAASQPYLASPGFLALAAFVSMPLVLHHAADARFYAPMLALCATIAMLLDRREHHTHVWSAATLALLSALLVATHYFGILALMCLGAGAFVCSRERLSARIAQSLPLLAGVITLVCLRPLLSAQQAALASAGGTWMSVGLAERLSIGLQQLFPLLPTVPIVAAVLVCKQPTRLIMHRIGPLAGLLAMPALVLLLDQIIQPVFVARYLIATLLPVAAIAGVAIALLSPRLRLTVVALLIASFTVTLLQKRSALTTQLDPRSTRALLQVIDVHPALPVFSDWRGYALPLTLARPQRDVRFLSLVPAFADPSLHGSIPFEALMADINARFYGVPRIGTARDAATVDTFLFITEFPDSVGSAFPARRVTQISPVAFLIER